MRTVGNCRGTAGCDGMLEWSEVEYGHVVPGKMSEVELQPV